MDYSIQLSVGKNNQPRKNKTKQHNKWCRVVWYSPNAAETILSCRSSVVGFFIANIYYFFSSLISFMRQTQCCCRQKYQMNFNNNTMAKYIHQTHDFSEKQIHIEMVRKRRREMWDIPTIVRQQRRRRQWRRNTKFTHTTIKINEYVICSEESTQNTIVYICIRITNPHCTLEYVKIDCLMVVKTVINSLVHSLSRSIT